jgi:hypothetical protein
MNDVTRFSDPEIESLVLGCALAGAYREPKGKLAPTDFNALSNQIVMEAMDRLAVDVGPSVARITHFLAKTGKLEIVGGMRSLRNVTVAKL